MPCFMSGVLGGLDRSPARYPDSMLPLGTLALHRSRLMCTTSVQVVLKLLTSTGMTELLMGALPSDPALLTPDRFASAKLMLFKLEDRKQNHSKEQG